MTHEFVATIEAADRGGAFVAVPPSVVDGLGGGGRIKAIATFDGVEYRGSVVTMGGGHVIGVLKRVSEQLGKAIGDRITVTLTRDDAQRTVDVPDDLRDALAAADLVDAFAELSYTHQREYVMSIDEAKRPATRAKRIAGTVDRVRGSRGNHAADQVLVLVAGNPEVDLILGVVAQQPERGSNRLRG